MKSTSDAPSSRCPGKRSSLLQSYSEIPESKVFQEGPTIENKIANERAVTSISLHGRAQTKSKQLNLNSPDYQTAADTKGLFEQERENILAQYNSWPRPIPLTPQQQKIIYHSFCPRLRKLFASSLTKNFLSIEAQSQAFACDQSKAEREMEEEANLQKEGSLQTLKEEIKKRQDEDGEEMEIDQKSLGHCAQTGEHKQRKELDNRDSKQIKPPIQVKKNEECLSSDWQEQDKLFGPRISQKRPSSVQRPNQDPVVNNLQTQLRITRDHQLWRQQLRKKLADRRRQHQGSLIERTLVNKPANVERAQRLAAPDKPHRQTLGGNTKSGSSLRKLCKQNSLTEATNAPHSGSPTSHSSRSSSSSSSSCSFSSSSTSSGCTAILKRIQLPAASVQRVGLRGQVHSKMHNTSDKVKTVALLDGSIGSTVQ
ncbi:unnamed protein product, partial [Protopolystoma xenopodis]